MGNCGRVGASGRRGGEGDGERVLIEVMSEITSGLLYSWKAKKSEAELAWEHVLPSQYLTMTTIRVTSDDVIIIAHRFWHRQSLVRRFLVDIVFSRLSPFYHDSGNEG